MASFLAFYALAMAALKTRLIFTGLLRRAPLLFWFLFIVPGLSNRSHCRASFLAFATGQWPLHSVRFIAWWSGKRIREFVLWSWSPSLLNSVLSLLINWRLFSLGSAPKQLRIFCCSIGSACLWSLACFSGSAARRMFYISRHLEFRDRSILCAAVRV